MHQKESSRKVKLSIFGSFMTKHYSHLGFLANVTLDHVRKKKIIFVDEDGKDEINCTNALEKYFNSYDVCQLNDDAFMVQFAATNIKKHCF